MSSRRSITTVLFTDIVGSTERAAELGDRVWRDLLARHHELVRRALHRYHGHEIATAGDGFLAVFDTAEWAILCGEAICEGVRGLGLEVRCGIHMGEVERTAEGDLGGIAVHVGARVAAEAGPGEILVTGGVRDAELGSGFGFEDRGDRELKGVPGEWRLWAVTDIPEGADAEVPVPEAPQAEPSPDLWSRIKGSRVVQVGAIYLLASWLVLQMTNLFIDSLGLPRWAMPAAVILLLIGLVVILATAWVQSRPETKVRAATGELPRPGAVDVAGLKDAVIRGQMPHLTWGRSLLGGAIAFSLLFGLAGLYVVIQDRGESFSPDPALAEAAAPGIAVLPFTVQAERLEMWREGMVDVLSANLDGVGGLRAIDSRTVLARWREGVSGSAVPDTDTALEIARRTGARYALMGSVVASGDGMRLLSDLYDLETGHRLAEPRVEGVPDSIFTLVDQLSIAILRPILWEASELPEVSLAQATTASLPALKAFLEGERLYRAGDFESAIPLYQQAVQADSTFGQGYFRQALCYGWVPDWERAFEMSAKAYRLVDRLPERDALLVRGLYALDTDAIDGLEILQTATRKFPDDPEAWYLLGELQFHRGEQLLLDPEEQRQSFLRAIELDPGFPAPYIHHFANVMRYEPDSTVVSDLVDIYGRVAPGTNDAREFRAVVGLAFGGDSAHAAALAALDTLSVPILPQGALDALRHARFSGERIELLELLLDNDPPEGARRAAVFLVDAYLKRGQLEAALRALEHPNLANERSDVDRMHLLYRAHIRGYPVPAERLERELGVSPSDTLDTETSFYVGAWAIESGREESYERVLGHLRESSQLALANDDSLTARKLLGTAGVLEGLTARQRGDLHAAERALEEARPMVSGSSQEVNRYARWWLAEVNLARGRLARAERFFSSLGHGQSFSTDPVAVYRQAQIQERLGQFEEALENYEYFLVAFENSDPEFRPWVEEARQAVIRLNGLRRE